MELRNFFFKTLIVIGTLAGLYVLFQVRGILLLFFGAILFASTIRPAVVFLKERGRISPVISILAIYLAFLVALVGVVVILFPTMLVSVQDLLNSQQTIFSALDQALHRIQFFADNGTGVHLPIPTSADLQDLLKQYQSSAQVNVETFLSGFQFLSEALILFVMAFYWLTERDRLEQVGARMVPLVQRERFLSIFNEIEATLGAFVRGELILCGTVGILSFVVLTVLGVRSAVVLAVFAAVAEAIPMVGPILGAIPALLVALLDSPEKALFVLIGYLIIQQIESQLLVPKVMERQVGLSPLFVLLALTSGNYLAGIVGALVAIPVAAALRILIRYLVVQPTVEANRLPVVGGAVLLPEDTAATETLAAANEEAETIAR